MFTSRGHEVILIGAHARGGGPQMSVFPIYGNKWKIVTLTGSLVRKSMVISKHLHIVFKWHQRQTYIHNLPNTTIYFGVPLST